MDPALCKWMRVACVLALAGCQRGGCPGNRVQGDVAIRAEVRATPDGARSSGSAACAANGFRLGGPGELGKLLSQAVLPTHTARDSIRRYVLARLPALPKLVDTATASAHTDSLRQRLLDEVVFRGVPASWREAPLRVEWLGEIAGGPGYRIRKLRYEALPGMWIPALLYVPDDLPDAARVPVVVNYGGHNVHGKAIPYHQIRCINQAKRGVLSLSVEWLGQGQLATPGYSHDYVHHLNLTGLSALGVFYLAADRAVDVALSLEQADPERIGVAGVSGGGWQSILLAALDPRIALVNSVAGFSDLRSRALYPSDLGDGEQLTPDFGALADYTHLVRMVAPRWQFLIYNARDNCCFRADYALTPLLQAGDPLYALFGKPRRLRSYINEVPGTHNFERDNREQHYRFLGEAFFPDHAAYDAVESDVKAELKTAAQLTVRLPPDNLDLRTLTSRQAQAEPLEAPPDAPDALSSWRREARARLASLVRAPRYLAEAEEVKHAQTCEGAPVAVRWWKLALGQSWQVPAIELTPSARAVADVPDGGAAQAGPLLVLADQGRAAAAEVVDGALQAGRRVVVMDPVLFGELQPRQADALARLIATVGGRALGVQAAQVGATARWLGERAGGQPVSLVALGMRASLTALVAAALEGEAIGAVELHGALTSLRELVSRSVKAPAAPEMFCFGLLRHFDMDALRSLVAPRPVVTR